jgi:cytosine/adenosine deaminase-related metal-dependent hydrolase
MMFVRRRPVAFVNATIVTRAGIAASMRFGARVLEIDGPPASGDAVIDLDGAVVLPGLVNAHDHLELNHYGAIKGRPSYANAGEWIDDMRPRLSRDAAMLRNRAYPLPAKLFIGGLKNLLAGVTTVAHHNPYYRGIARACPIRVLDRYGWAHSLALERGPVGARGEPGGDVQARFGATAPTVPFMVHAAEGVDQASEDEFARLDGKGCVAANTVLVHGVALTLQNWARLVEQQTSLVWCPASNAFLFGRTAPIREFLDHSASSRDRICLGTDSRLTGARDLLDELRVAQEQATSEELLRMVTSSPRCALRLRDAGEIAEGAAADLVVFPRGSRPADVLVQARRSDVRLVTIAGRPMVGATELAPLFEARDVPVRSIRVDGVERVAGATLARAIGRCPIAEPGVEIG